MKSSAQRVVVVTGAATGIGAAIAEELGRSGAHVVALDANVAVDGSSAKQATGPSTAERIVAAGGSARSANLSVTDRAGVSQLFDDLVAEFGALDAVVNVAGISRPTSFTDGEEQDWDDVLTVHLGGYLTVLGAALPLMAQAGHGRIVGVTSGSGWRPANTGAYGCAKRAVASLTWQLGGLAPEGVTINALSPIAATRMVAAALGAGPAGDDESSRRATTGGISLAGFPPPENLGPVGAYLASEQMAWCSGRIFFSGGAELALVAAPRPIEVVRSRPAVNLRHVLSQVVPQAFVAAQASQGTGGGGSARFTTVFDEAADADASSPGETTAPPSCVVATDDPAWRRQVEETLGTWGINCAAVDDPSQGFAGASAQLVAAAERAGRPVDAVVLATAPTAAPASSSGWESVLADHADVAGSIRGDAAWARAVADYSATAGRPVRLIVLAGAASPAGRTRAQAAAQHSRSAMAATQDRVSVCAISCECGDEADRRAAVELAAHLLTTEDGVRLSGAELYAGAGRLGLRSHPTPAGTVTYGGPGVPDWIDAAVHELVGRA